jgi:hypothetical protein
MAKYEGKTLFISVLAIIICIGSAIYSGMLSEKLASSDHKAKEQVKADTAKLLSTLRSLMNKGALSSTTKDAIDIKPEKDAISEFMNSQTGFAYYSWVDEKSSQAESEGRQGGSWRVFFLYLSELANADNAYVAARRAADVELLFDDLSEDDVEKIAYFNSDLIQAISENSKNREGNVVIKALVESQKERQIENSSENLLAKLTFLKNKGINDPNIDMFIATITGEISILEKALEAGADPHITDAALLRKYENELEDFGK